MAVVGYWDIGDRGLFSFNNHFELVVFHYKAYFRFRWVEEGGSSISPAARVAAAAAEEPRGSDMACPGLLAACERVGNIYSQGVTTLEVY
jgi:hypothetical protein